MMLLFLSILGVFTAVWYFRKRRELTLFTRNIVEELEATLRPADKVYELLGYLVGFKAKFKLSRPNALNAYITFTTVPTYSLLYYPIAKMLSRKNMLGLAIEYKKGLLRNLHIIPSNSKKYESILSRDVPNLSDLRVLDIEVLGAKYRAYFEDYEDLKIVINELIKYGIKPMQFSVFKSKNLIYILIEAKLGIVKSVYQLINSVYRELAGTSGIRIAE